VARPLVVGVVQTGVDVPVGLHAVAHAADAPSVRLPLSSVEPMYGLSSQVLVAESNQAPGRGRPVPQHQQRGSTLHPERTSLPVRLPGQYVHPQLRHPPWPTGRAGSSA
jgi:hypothetical protein